MAPWLTLLLAACTLSPPPDPGETTWQGEGFAVSVPAGASVAATGDLLRVDLPDGERWFDVQWVETPAVPAARFTQWALETCEPVQWDLAAEPVPGVVVMGGICRIGDRSHWVTASLEQRGERSLLVVAGVRRDRLPFEEARVVHARTALTLAAGDAPLPAPEAAEIRAMIRKLVQEGAVGRAPTPGGGTLSARVSAAQADLWARRMATPQPERFRPPEARQAPE